VFLYTVQQFDASVDLNYKSPSSLVLNGAIIYRNTYLNDTVANITLPYVTDQSSLASQKNIIINTQPSLIIAMQVISPPGTYTVGDTIDFSLTYNTPVIVTGTPIFWLNNTATALNAYVETVPSDPVFTFYRSKPDSATQIVIGLTLNWALQYGTGYRFTLFYCVHMYLSIYSQVIICTSSFLALNLPEQALV